MSQAHSAIFCAEQKSLQSPHCVYNGPSDVSQRRTSAVLFEYWLLSSVLSQSRDICGGNVTIYQCISCSFAQMCSCFLGGKVRKQ